jgi:hypothetical protein
MRGTWGTQIRQEDEPIRSVNGIGAKAQLILLTFETYKYSVIAASQS